MAIFGTFKDLSFPDVIALVAKDSGILKVYHPRCRLTFELRIRNGTLVGMTVGGRPVENTPALRQYMMEIALEESAEFSYERVPLPREPAEFDLPVERLAGSCLAALSEPDPFVDHLPHPDTVFVVNEDAEAWLEDDLFDFWCKVYPLLQAGASGSQIQKALGLDLQEVLFQLFKLRALGLIIPYRQFEKKAHKIQPEQGVLPHAPSRPNQPDAAQPRTRPHASIGRKKGWIGRLIAALTRRWCNV